MSMKKIVVGLVVAAGMAGTAYAQQARQQSAQNAVVSAQAAQQRSPQSVDPNSMVMAALQAVQLVDAGRSAEVWDGSAEVSKRALSRNAFVQQVTATRAPLGQPVSRVWLSVIRQSAPEPGSNGGPPQGDYISVRFATRFSGGNTVAELVTFRLESNGIWRVAGYAIQ
ncbi:DUF4019 domain-containing protein [Luteimonas sp. e5]